MFHKRETGSAITFRGDRMVGHANAVAAACRDFLRRNGAPEGAATMVVFRELFRNAITHGNGKTAASSVFAQIRNLGDGQFAVTVRDKGEGFDYRRVANTPVPDDPRRVPHRGYVLIRSLSRRLEFNDTGNRITAYVMENGEVRQGNAPSRNNARMGRG